MSLAISDMQAGDGKPPTFFTVYVFIICYMLNPSPPPRLFSVNCAPVMYMYKYQIRDKITSKVNVYYILQNVISEDSVLRDTG
jgi:hypothetical protein